MINKLYCENNIDTMSRMPDEFIDLTVTSPPYDNLRDYEGYIFDFEKTATELYRVTKNGGVVIWVVADQTINGSESGTSFRQALFFMSLGFNLHDTMIYRKENYVPLTHRRYEQQFEYMFCFSKGKPKTFNPILIPCKYPGKVEFSGEGRRQNFGKMHSTRIKTNNVYSVTKETKLATNIFTYTLGANKSGHPAAFPEALPSDQIKTWTNEGDLVYDCFSGSGRTLISAAKLKRNYIGSEISSNYCKKTDKELLIYSTQLSIF
jgi:DNA modification methylase